MRRNGQIVQIPSDQLLDNARKDTFVLESSPVDLPVGTFIEEKAEKDEIGLKWMYVDDLIQFKLKRCLIHYDLNTKKEVACLNNYQDIFDKPQQFVLTPFFIPVRDMKTDKPSREYIALSHNQTFVQSYTDKLKGRIYNMHDELSLHSLINISRRHMQGKKIAKIDLKLMQSTYLGNSVFHLCYNNYAILEKLHLQICGSATPGEVGDTFSQTVGEIGIEAKSGSAFETPWFKRMVQLLIRKNLEGDSPLNLAIRNKNFRCFELMLSILLNANDVFISKNFLSDMSNMLEVEANTVETFFD